ncbi:hypothetical protein T4B_1872, partial [Trichinella pseudospiralis]
LPHASLFNNLPLRELAYKQLDLCLKYTQAHDTRTFFFDFLLSKFFSWVYIFNEKILLCESFLPFSIV